MIHHDQEDSIVIYKSSIKIERKNNQKAKEVLSLIFIELK